MGLKRNQAQVGIRRGEISRCGLCRRSLWEAGPLGQKDLIAVGWNYFYADWALAELWTAFQKPDSRLRLGDATEYLGKTNL